MPVIRGTPNNPPRMSDEGQGSRDSIAHHHPAPKGESAKDFPQIGGQSEGSRTYQLALEKGLSHGSRAHGGPQLDRAHISAGAIAPGGGFADSPKHTADPSYAGVGRPESMRRRASHG